MQKGLTQKDFAARVKLAYAQYNRYERGDNRPTAEILSKLADALGVTVDYLLDGKEEAAAVASFEDRELLKLFEETEKLPAKDKEMAKELLDSFLFKRRVKQMA